MNVKHLLILVVAGLVSVFALSGCKGEEAVNELQKIRDKTCGCEGDEACIKEAKEMVGKWLEEYSEARGGDQEKAEKLAMEIAECSPEVALEFAK